MVRRHGESDEELLERANEDRYAGYNKQEVEAKWAMGCIETRCQTPQRLDGDVSMAEITETREETYVKATWKGALDDFTWELQSQKSWQDRGFIRRVAKDETRIRIEHEGSTHELKFEGTPTRGEVEQAAERATGVRPLTAEEGLRDGAVHMEKVQSPSVTVRYMDWGEHPHGLKMRDEETRWGMNEKQVQVKLEQWDNWGEVARRNLHIMRPDDQPRHGQTVWEWQSYGVVMDRETGTSSRESPRKTSWGTARRNFVCLVSSSPVGVVPPPLVTPHLAPPTLSAL
jgi:hypothetical protein